MRELQMPIVSVNVLCEMNISLSEEAYVASRRSRKAQA